MTHAVAPGTRTEVASETARRVADAAVSVVARDGFDLLSVRSVACKAGVSGVAIQHHFATREDLLRAAFAQTVKNISTRLAAAELDEGRFTRCCTGCVSKRFHSTKSAGGKRSSGSRSVRPPRHIPT